MEGAARFCPPGNGDAMTTLSMALVVVVAFCFGLVLGGILGQWKRGDE